MANNKKSLIFGALSLLPGVLFAQGVASDPAEFGLSLEQLADIKVESASLVPTTLARAPAIVTVIGQDDMKTWVDRSVGEALARVTGFYRLDAQGVQDVGVRGAFGGQRS
jgi:outer membrane receptor for ferrienterochelin and colicin